MPEVVEVVEVPKVPKILEVPKVDDLVKSHIEAARWLTKKFDIQGVVFLAGARQYMWYVEPLPKTYNAVDRIYALWVLFTTPSKVEGRRIKYYLKGAERIKIKTG